MDALTREPLESAECELLQSATSLQIQILVFERIREQSGKPSPGLDEAADPLLDYLLGDGP